MRIDLITREYPPQVYGGAGVHVAELTRSLRTLADVRVRCLGEPVDEAGTTGYPPTGLPPDAGAALRFLAADVLAAADCAGADVVHSHTWYANAAGHAAGLAHGVPHVMTMHSLEPLRPWKAEQLGSGYALSSWMERTAAEGASALIAVSAAMRADVLAAYPQVDPERVHVIHNGIDTGLYRPDRGTEALLKYGIDPDRPIVLFVGRVTRQKGLSHLLRAARELRRDAQLVLCCGAADTPELAVEVEGLVSEARRAGVDVCRVDGMLDRGALLQLLTHARVFVCPSVYEPMGIVNLEAMAAETAVVATAVGGIPEVVQDGVTGLLVPYERAEGDVTGEPVDPAALAAGLAAAVNSLLDDPEAATRMGRAGRARAAAEFSWPRIAARTLTVYEEAVRRF